VYDKEEGLTQWGRYAMGKTHITQLEAIPLHWFIGNEDSRVIEKILGQL